MYKIGILFDIDELESSLYGNAAYEIFFGAIDTRQIAGCTLSDGDTNATIAGRANQYCIAVESLDASKIATVKSALSKSNVKGLLPLASRFVESTLVSREPLVTAAHINAAGELIGCQTGWVMSAWEKTREKHQGSGSTAMPSSTTPTGEKKEAKMGLLERIFGRKSEGTTAGVPASSPVPDPTNEQDYVRACSESAFAERMEEHMGISDKLFDKSRSGKGSGFAVIVGSGFCPSQEMVQRFLADGYLEGCSSLCTVEDPIGWTSHEEYREKAFRVAFAQARRNGLDPLNYERFTYHGDFPGLGRKFFIVRYLPKQNDNSAVNQNPESSCAVCGSSLPNLHMYQTMNVSGGSWGYCENCKKLFCKNHSRSVDVCYYEGEVEYTKFNCPDCNNPLKSPSTIWRKNL
jgi:hypothetical protein